MKSLHEAGRIEQRLEKLKQQSQKGFVAYLTAGDPSMKSTVDAVLRLEDAGADIIELGVPFSDPLADGRVNQESAARALKGGMTLRRLLDGVVDLRKKSDIPLVLYSYINPLLTPEFGRNMALARKAGVDGMLLLDLPAEEGSAYYRTLYQQHLDNIQLVTPTTPDERIRKIVKYATGFVYCVSREGVTGMQKKLGGTAVDVVRRTKALTPLPVVLGFGISTPEHARAAARAADAVVVGSAIVDRFAQEPDTAAGRARATTWVRRLIRAVKSV